MHSSGTVGKGWGTCTSSCGCAKNRKTGCERLPGWHRISWVVWGPSDTVIFEREAVQALQKNAPVFEVLAMETLARDSAPPPPPPMRIARTLALYKFLVTALCSKRPSAWTLFTSWCFTSCGEKSMWRATRQNLLRGSCDPASPYTPTSPIQFPVGLPSLQSARSSRFWGWWWRTLVVQFYILSKGLPTTVLQTWLSITFMDVGVFGENRRRNWDDYSLNNVVYNAGSIVKYMYSIARQVADGLRRVATVRSVHREDSFQKNQRFWK